MALGLTGRLLALACLVAGLAGARPLTSFRGSGALYAPQQRAGVGVAPHDPLNPDHPGRITDYAGVESLGIGWYADWTIRLDPPRPAGIEFAQTLETRAWLADPPAQDYLDRVAAIARAHPGSLWIVGNEPDHPGQGACTPSEYAQVYHRAYAWLKSADATAQVAIGGIVMPSPIRLMWLEQVLNAYEELYGAPMPVDIWNTHMQILRENWWDQEITYSGPCADGGAWGAGYPHGLDPYDPAVRSAALSDLSSCDSADPALFRELIEAFRAWLWDQGQGDKPLIVSEYGVLMPDALLRHGAADVSAFMQSTMTYMMTATDPVLGYSADGGRLVQRWLWFSLNGPLARVVEVEPGRFAWQGFNGSLYDPRDPERLTPLGEAFRDEVTRWHLVRPYRAHLPLVIRERH